MIVAGAGSGKTKVLTTRVIHLMAAHAVDAFNILALTFTNKAAKEMKERVEKILGNGAVSYTHLNSSLAGKHTSFHIPAFVQKSFADIQV